MRVKTIKYYRLVIDLMGDKETPCSYSPENFTSKKSAKDFWKAEYRDRNKGDGYDNRWNNTPLRIQQVIETTTNFF